MVALARGVPWWGQWVVKATTRPEGSLVSSTSVVPARTETMAGSPTVIARASLRTRI